MNISVTKALVGLVILLALSLAGVTLYAYHQHQTIEAVLLEKEKEKAIASTYKEAYTAEWQRIYRQETNDLQTKLSASQAELADLSAKLRDGTLRLREKFTCPVRVSADAGPGVEGGEPSPVITPADERFLIQLSADADRWRAERNYAIRMYNKIAESLNEKTPDQK